MKNKRKDSDKSDKDRDGRGEERKDWVGGQNQTPLYICVLY